MNLNFRLPTDEEVSNWYDENIGHEKCSASSGIYKFRRWLKELQNNYLLGLTDEQLQAHSKEIRSRIKKHISSMPPAQEAELWKEFLAEANRQQYQLDAELKTEDEIIADLQTKYQLSLKSEQPEAVEFAEWANENLKPMFDSNGKLKFWIKNSGIHEKDITTEEAYKEYQLYKQKKAP